MATAVRAYSFWLVGLGGAAMLALAAPGLLVLATAGLQDLGQRLAPQAMTVGPVRLALVGLFLLSIQLMAPHPRASGVRGYAGVADALLLPPGE